MTIKQNIARATIILSAFGLLSLPASAAVSKAPAPQQQGQQRGQQKGQHAQAPRGPLTVSYYAGNPAQGGKLLKTVTLQPPVRGPEGQQGQPPKGQQPDVKPNGNGNGQPQRGDGQGEQHEHHGRGGHGHGHHGGAELIKAQAPAGATFAVIKGADGESHTIDLTKAEVGPQDKDNGPTGGPQNGPKGQQPKAPNGQ